MSKISGKVDKPDNSDNVFINDISSLILKDFIRMTVFFPKV